MRDTPQIVTNRHDLNAYLNELLRQVEYSERLPVGYRPPDFELIEEGKARERRERIRASQRRKAANALGLGTSASIMLGIAIGMIVILVDPPPVPVIGEGMASAFLIAASLWVIAAFAWLVWGVRHRQ